MHSFLMFAFIPQIYSSLILAPSAPLNLCSARWPHTLFSPATPPASSKLASKQTSLTASLV